MPDKADQEKATVALTLEIRNLMQETSEAMGTFMYTANVYVNGKKAGTAEQRGDGGPTMIRPLQLEDELNEHGKTLPNRTLDMGQGRTVEYTPTAEHIIDDLVHRHLDGRILKRKLKRFILFTRKGKRGIFTTKALRPEDLISITHNQEIARKQFDAWVMLNFIPFEEALDLYQRETLATVLK